MPCDFYESDQSMRWPLPISFCFLLSLCQSTCFQFPGFLRQKRCLSTVSYMLHIGYVTLPWDLVCSLSDTPLVCVFWTTHVQDLLFSRSFWDRFSFFDGFIKIRWEIVPFIFPQIKAEWCRLWHNNWVVSHADRAVLCAGDWIQNRLLTHIRNVWRYKDEVRVVCLLPYWNDFGSFALWMSDNLFESAHCSTASSSPSVVVYPQRVLWLLKSPITMWGLILCPSGGSRNGSGGGLCMECTTTPGSSTVRNSTFSSSHTEMLFTFRPSLTKTELPCLLCGRSATSVIPAIFGLTWSLARCVSWRHRQWQCCILHTSDSMDALLADRLSMFADITVIL